MKGPLLCRDDDMQSTFSAMSAGQDSVTYDEEDDEEMEEEGRNNGGLTSPTTGYGTLFK